MKKEVINIFIRSGKLRMRQPDTERIKSIIKSAENNAKVAKSIPLNEESATVIFRELYESIRQLGDAKWWLLGYEPLSHDVSMEVIKEMDVKEKVKLNNLLRFKRIRNDVNYRGFMVSVSQAKEIIEFWDTCGKEIANLMSKKMKRS
jgi:hypothetical protein